MNVVLNGKPATLREDATVEQILQLLELPERGVAVAIDAEVVPRGQWPATRLHEGARVEVVQAVQGG